MEPLLMKHVSRIKECELENPTGDVRSICSWLFNFRIDTNLENLWSNSVFERLLHAFHFDDSYTETVSPETLTVTSDSSSGVAGVELRVIDVPNIATYCLTESIGKLNEDAYEWVKVVDVLHEDLPDELPLSVTSTIKTENKLSAYDNIDWYSSMKMYKLTKEFRFENKNSIVKLVIVRQSEESSTKMASSGVSAAHMTYEFNVVSKVRDEKNMGEVIESCIPVIQLLLQTMYPLSKLQQGRVLADYDALVKKVLEIPKWRTNKPANANASDNDKKALSSSLHFLAPKPITLESIHLVEPGPETYGIQTIMEGYAVTDKADGERMLMYISKQGHAYLINNIFEVFGTGLHTARKELFDSILDGEYISKSLMKNNHNDVFAVFDIYFQEAKSVMSLPLMTPSAGKNASSSSSKTSRYELMQKACEASSWISSTNALVELRCKEHIGGDGKSIFDSCKSILQNAKNLPYDIDGLIFTPRDLSVYGHYPGIPMPIPENALWDKVMKWKPSDQNSIDFLVDEVEDGYRVDPITNKRYKQFRLFTGYNATQWEPITPLEGIRLRYDYRYENEKKAMRRHYYAKEFKPFSNYTRGVEIAELPVNAAGDVECQDGSLVDKNRIIEFAYDTTTKDGNGGGDGNANVSRRWIPMRVRDDKTRILQKAIQSRQFPPNLPSKTANDLNVAISIWRSIHDPVTRDHITGVTPISSGSVPDNLEERLLGVDDVYYARDIPREHRLSVNMMNFHNHGIKKSLYEKSDRRDSLLELACGMAGDLPRWREGGYRFVLGVDLSRDNITNPRHGAYSRMLKQKQAIGNMNRGDGLQKAQYIDAVFIVGDCGASLQNGEAVGEDKESQKILQVLYNQGRGQNTIPHHVAKHIAGRAANGFSVVSCMFAIHYFFKSESSLDAFLGNVASNLRKNGIFITTFMDGDKVNALLTADKESKGVVEGRKLNGKVPIWAIIKRYDKFDKDNCWGKHVDVFLENTNKLIPEFVVNFDKLVEKAQNHGLALAEDGMFVDTFNNILAGARGKNRLSHLETSVLALEKDPVQTKFSFLNRWAVFKKM